MDDAPQPTPTPNGEHPPRPTVEDAQDGDTPQPPPAPEKLSLTFREISGTEVMVNLKPETKFGKAMEAVSARFGREMRQLRFLVDGARLLPDDTPASKELEDGDTIDVAMEQIGGVDVTVTEGPDQWMLVTARNNEAYIAGLHSQIEGLQARLRDAEGNLNLTVVYDEDKKVFFKVKRTTKLEQVFWAFAERQGLDHFRLNQLCFLYDGTRLSGDDTVGTHGMTDGDTIDAILNHPIAST